MVKLKKIRLVNYCGYKNFELDLTDGDDIKKWMMFYGPNGIGKSNFVRAVDFLSSSRKFKGRSNALILRKLKYHHNYIAGTEALLDDVSDLYMEGIFETSDGEKRVVIEDNIQGQLTIENKNAEDNISGVTVSELPAECISAALYVDADNPMMMQKFQFYKSMAEPFIDFAEAIYGFKCSFPESSFIVDKGITFYTDLVLEKPDGTKVHYKRFSDGEKKIATLISTLFKKSYQNDDPWENNIILVDNIEQHIYFERHMKLIKKMEEYFSEHQIIASTHSPIIVNQMDKKYLCNLGEKLKK